MRHSDIATTMNVYGKALQASMVQANSKVVDVAIPSKDASETLIGSSGSLVQVARAGK
jgi:proteasome assembly chaperone (PAC2) family protein